MGDCKGCNYQESKWCHLYNVNLISAEDYCENLKKNKGEIVKECIRKKK